MKYGEKIDIPSPTELIDRKKVSKFISNNIQRIKNGNDTEKLQEVIKALQKNMQWLSKNAHELDNYAEKQIYGRCSDIYSNMIEFYEMTRENTEDLYDDVMQRYICMSCDISGE